MSISSHYGNFEVSVIDGYVKLDNYYIIEPDDPVAKEKVALFVYAFNHGEKFHKERIKEVLGV